MGKHGKKQFIDKKSAVKFKVVHRSQYDPLIADDQAPKYVLVPVGGDVDRAEEFVNYGTDAADHEPESSQDSKYSRLEQQAQYGIYYDDDYDYMQHLKETGAPDAYVIEANVKPQRNVRFELPDEVFPSAEQNDYAPADLALAQSAGLTAELLEEADFDVLAQLDDDAEHCDDWAIDDDFVSMAQAPASKDRTRRGSGSGGDAGDSDENGDNNSVGGQISSGDEDFAIEETRSRFTEYSMTSSVMHRNDKLQLLDERFERMYAEYDEDEIGELDEETADGLRDIREFEDVLDEYILSRENIDYDPDNKPEQTLRQCPLVRHVIEESIEEDMTEEERTAWRLRMERRDEWIEDTYRARRAEEEEETKWDCETILTTYTNIYNHPKLISEKKAPKPAPAPAAVPETVSDDEQVNSSDEDDGEEHGDAVSKEAGIKGAKRDKGESKEDKRARKQAVKAARKERRSEKKTTKLAFKAEQLRQEKINTTKAVRL